MTQKLYQNIYLQQSTHRNRSLRAEDGAMKKLSAETCGEQEPKREQDNHSKWQAPRLSSKSQTIKNYEAKRKALRICGQASSVDSGGKSRIST
jgi:hypothetical protein